MGTDIDKMPVGVVHLTAYQLTHHKLVPVAAKDGGPYLCVLVGTDDSGVNPGAIKFDTFDNAMHFVSDIMDGIEETWPAQMETVKKGSKT